MSRSVEVRAVQLGAPTGGQVNFLVEEQPDVRCVMKLGARGIRLHWEAMLQLGRQFKEEARRARRLRNGYVAILFDGALEAAIPANIATELFAAGAIHIARRAEELVKHEQVAHDAATLIRAGVPVGLAVDPRVRANAAAAAVNDDKLRRYMPGGVKSTMVPLPPRIIRHAPSASQQVLFKAWEARQTK